MQRNRFIVLSFFLSFFLEKGHVFINKDEGCERKDKESSKSRLQEHIPVGTNNILKLFE